MPLTSPYGNGKADLTNPADIAAVPPPEAAKNVKVKKPNPKYDDLFTDSSTVQPEQPSPAAGGSPEEEKAKALEQSQNANMDQMALANPMAGIENPAGNLGESLNAIQEDKKGGAAYLPPVNLDLPNQAKNPFFKKTVESRIAGFDVRSNADGTIDVRGEGNKWAPITENQQKLFATVYDSYRNLPASIASTAVSAVPGFGGKFAKAAIGAARIIGAGGASYLGDQLTAPSGENQWEFVARRAAGLDDSSAFNYGSPAMKAVLASGVQGLGEGIGVASSILEKKAAERAASQALRADAIEQSSKEIVGAMNKHGIVPTPAVQVGALPGADNIRSIQYGIAAENFGPAARDALIQAEKDMVAQTKSALQNIKAQVSGGADLVNPEVLKTEQKNGMKRYFFGRMIDQKEAELGFMHSASKEIAGNRFVADPSQFIKMAEDQLKESFANQKINGKDIVQRNTGRIDWNALNEFEQSQGGRGSDRFLPDFINEMNNLKAAAVPTKKDVAPTISMDQVDAFRRKMNRYAYGGGDDSEFKSAFKKMAGKFADFHNDFMEQVFRSAGDDAMADKVKILKSEYNTKIDALNNAEDFLIKNKSKAGAALLKLEPQEALDLLDLSGSDKVKKELKGLALQNAFFDAVRTESGGIGLGVNASKIKSKLFGNQQMDSTFNAVFGDDAKDIKALVEIADRMKTVFKSQNDYAMDQGKNQIKKAVKNLKDLPMAAAEPLFQYFAGNDAKAKAFLSRTFEELVAEERAQASVLKSRATSYGRIKSAAPFIPAALQSGERIRESVNALEGKRISGGSQ